MERLLELLPRSSWDIAIPLRPHRQTYMPMKTKAKGRIPANIPLLENLVRGTEMLSSPPCIDAALVVAPRAAASPLSVVKHALANRDAAHASQSPPVDTRSCAAASVKRSLPTNFRCLIVMAQTNPENEG